ncbi:hypothetical protein HZB90_00060 [archaeon]|nr:hypothetical protein [archaeon]
MRKMKITRLKEKNHGRRSQALTNNIAKLIQRNPIISMTNEAALTRLTGGDGREAARFEAAHPEIGHDFFISSHDFFIAG